MRPVDAGFTILPFPAALSPYASPAYGGYGYTSQPADPYSYGLPDASTAARRVRLTLAVGAFRPWFAHPFA
jgi:hypothetical protein